MASNLFRPSMPEDFFSTNIENVCRICLQTGVTLISIFRDEIDEMVSDFLPKKVDLQDNFPHQICIKCAEDVKIAYAFKKQAEYSHEVIKKMLDGKRLPRSSNKKSYEEINEDNIFRTKSLPTDTLNGGTSFICHICERRLTRRVILQKHLERVHKFYNFEERYSHLFDNNTPNKSSTNYNKGFTEESYVEEMTFPILPQVIMVDDDNDMQGDDNDDDYSMEEKDDPFKTHAEDIANSNSDKLKSSTPYQQQHPFDCHICHKRLTRRYYLKCHLERVHQFYDIDAIKPKLIPMKNSKLNESLEKFKSSIAASSSHIKPKHDDRNDDSNIGHFECRICRKVLTRRYGLKKHYEIVHNIIDNDNKPIDLTYDGSSDEHEAFVPLPVLPRLETPKIKLEKNKSESIPNMNKNQPKNVNVYICHICEKEFSGRATMRRHLKNVHKFKDFENNIWLSKVYQKNPEIQLPLYTTPATVHDDNEFDQSYKHDDDIDMHAYLLCPEVVLTTGDDNHPGIGNVKHGAGGGGGSSLNAGSTSGGGNHFNPNRFRNDLKVKHAKDKKIKNKVEPLKLKLGVLSVKNISPPKQKKPPKIRKNIFSCKHCQKPFDRVDHLRRHELTHTKPFNCQFCGKGFYRKDLLGRHENAAHSKLIQQQQVQLQPNDQNSGFYSVGNSNNDHKSNPPNFDNENSFEDNENSMENNENEHYNDEDDVDDNDGNDDDDDDDDGGDDNHHENFEDEQNLNEGSNSADIHKEDSNEDSVEKDENNSNADTEENNIKDAQEENSNSNSTNYHQNSNSNMAEQFIF